MTLVRPPASVTSDAPVVAAAGNDIGWAVAQLAAGLKVRRSGWDGTQLYVVQDPTPPTGVMAIQNYYSVSAGSGTAMWQIHQADLLNADWVTVT
jgi:hypothetical protein